MKIKYNKTIPIVMMVLAASSVILFYISKQKGIKVDESMNYIVPFVFFASIPMLFVNYLEISDREIIVRSQFGSVLRRYAINSLSEVSMVNNRIFLDKPNKKEEVKFRRMYASKKGLRELNAKLNHLI